MFYTFVQRHGVYTSSMPELPSSLVIIEAETPKAAAIRAERIGKHEESPDCECFPCTDGTDLFYGTAEADDYPTVLEYKVEEGVFTSFSSVKESTVIVTVCYLSGRRDYFGLDPLANDPANLLAILGDPDTRSTWALRKTKWVTPPDGSWSDGVGLGEKENVSKTAGDTTVPTNVS